MARRIRRKAIDSSTSNIDEVKTLADKIERDQEKVAQMQEQTKKDLLELHAQMVGLNIMEVTGKVGVGERFTPVGRSTNIIDPVQYEQKVDRDAFMSSIKVSATEAKEHLSGKALQSISTTIPAQKKKESVRVKSISDKKKK